MPAAARHDFTPFSAQLTGSLDQISKMIEDNARMVDLIQEVALGLTNAANTLLGVTGKYVGMGDDVLDTLLPVLRNLPIIPENVMGMLDGLEGMTKKLADNQEGTAKTLAEVHSSLSTGDVSKLQAHAAELQQLSKTLTSILPR
jgi:hypothetical protein